MDDADNQATVTHIEKRLAVAEKALSDVLIALLKNPRPFSDKDANGAFINETRDFAELYFGTLGWHSRMAFLVEQNLSDVEFGGDK